MTRQWNPGSALIRSMKPAKRDDPHGKYAALV